MSFDRVIISYKTAGAPSQEKSAKASAQSDQGLCRALCGKPRYKGSFGNSDAHADQSFPCTHMQYCGKCCASAHMIQSH